MNIYNDSDAVVSVSTPVLVTPATETFEAATYPPAGWGIVNPDASYTWERRTGITGATGATTAANYINNYTYNSPSAEDYLVTPTINLLSAATAELTFDVSYARYGVGYEDGLRVDVSTDCGLTLDLHRLSQNRTHPGYGRNGYQPLYAFIGSTMAQGYDQSHTVDR